MHRYRISKYNPKYRNDKGIYLKNDWTSFCDIGKKYGKKILTKEDYLNTELKYCDVISEILEENNIEEMIIKDLECVFTVDELKRMFEENGLEFSNEDEKLIISLSDNKTIKIIEAKRYVKLILRDCFWCIFKNETTSVRVEFGYDFYVYVYNVYISEMIISKYREKEIFIEILDS